MASTALAVVNKIKGELEASRPTFEQMNLNKLSVAQEYEFALQMIEKNDYLAKMPIESIKTALINVALSGITLNPVMKFAHLVPRKGVCCLDVSYQGLIKIITDTGSVKSVRANVVYDKDTFDIELGSGGYVKHKPFLGAEKRGRKIGAYSLAVLNDGSDHIDFMRWDEIMAVKARSEAATKGFSPWSSDEDEMAKKTVVKRHWKYLPKSERALVAANAIDFDNQLNGIDFEKETEIKTLADYVDQQESDEAHIDEFEEDEIDATLTKEIFEAPDNKTLKAIHDAHPELHEIGEFKEKLNKRRAFIAQARAQHEFEQQNKTIDGTAA